MAEEILVHTGQHYDEAMSDSQILATRLPRPDHNLGVGSRVPREQVALAQERLEELIAAERPDAVIVRGDTNATLSGARAAAAAGVPLVHVEAGLRSLSRGHARGVQPHPDRPAIPGPLRAEPRGQAQPGKRGRERRDPRHGRPAVRHARTLAPERASRR